MEKTTSTSLEYVKLSPEEMESRGILGRLVGICADFIIPTRNGRKYNEDLWEKVFNNPIMKEKIENKVCYGELGHPADRLELNMEKACVQLAEQPKKGPDGKLRAVFDILSTPNGQILNTLCKYGSVLGVSSRGEGDIITDQEGNEMVDPDTYTCECFDIVQVPAVKAARLQYVTESLDTRSEKMKNELRSLIESASANEKPIMEDSVRELGLLVGMSLNESVQPTEDAKERDLIAEQSAKELLELNDDEDLKAVDDDDEKQILTETEEKVEEDFTYTIDDGEDTYDVTRNKAIRKGCDEDEEKLESAEDEAIIDGETTVKSEDGEIELTVSYERGDDLSDETIRDTIREIIVKAADKWDFQQEVKFLDDRLSITLSDFGTEAGFQKHLTEIVDDIRDVLGLPVDVNSRRGDFKLTADDITLARRNKAGEVYTQKMFDGDIKDNNTSGITGVSKESNTGMWRAYITIDGQKVVIGHYDTRAMARRAREKATRIAVNSALSTDEKIDKIKAITITEGLEENASIIEELVGKRIIPENVPSSDEGVDIIDAISKGESAINVGEDLVTELQEQLIENSQLNEKIRVLQEKLSVCYTKEAETTTQLQNCNAAIERLTESNKSIEPLKRLIKSLKEELTEKDNECAGLQSSVHTLNEKTAQLIAQKKSLVEQLGERESAIKRLNEQVEKLGRDAEGAQHEYNEKLTSLTESLAGTKRDSQVTTKRLNEKLEESARLVEQYKNDAKKAMNRYIESQAVKLGVSSSDITSRLNENYTFDDVDAVCESMYSYTSSMNSLPINLRRGNRVRINEQADPMVQKSQIDEVDNDLLSLVGLR